MQALAVVPDLDVVEDDLPGLGTSGKLLGSAFGLQGANETLHRRIVVAVAPRSC